MLYRPNRGGRALPARRRRHRLARLPSAMNWDERIEEVRKFNRRYARLFNIVGFIVYMLAIAWIPLLVWWLL